MQDYNGRARADFTDEWRTCSASTRATSAATKSPPRASTFIAAYMKPIRVTFTERGRRAGGRLHLHARGLEVQRRSQGTNGGVVWATMDTGRNKGFEDEQHDRARQWGTWGNVRGRRATGAGSTPAPTCCRCGATRASGRSGRRSRSAATRPARISATTTTILCPTALCVGIAIEWYGKDGRYLGVLRERALTTNTPGNPG